MHKFAAVAAIVLLFLVDAALAAPRHSRGPAFRAHGLFQPVTPRVLSHRGLPTRFPHGVRFRAQGLFEPLTPAPPAPLARRRVRPILIGVPLLAAGPGIVAAEFWYGPVQAAPRPAPKAPVAPVGCIPEDISVPATAGQTTVTVIRC
jgi:hypothetical protein